MKCDKCDGTGQLQMVDGDHWHDMECDYCDGTGEKRMEIKLFGLPTCSRCKSAKMMLDKRKEKGIIDDYIYEEVNPTLVTPLLV